MMFWDVLVLALVFSLVGYMRGREDGRAAERRDVRFTPVDKLEPREGYDSQSHYCPPLNDARWELDDHYLLGGIDPCWEVERPQQNSGPKKHTLQGYTRGSDPYRYYDLEEL